MSKVIHRVMLDTNIWEFQTLATFGGRIVSAIQNEQTPNLIEVYFEIDREVYRRVEDPDRLFHVVSTGQAPNANYEHVATVPMAELPVIHIYQFALEAKDESDQDVLSEHGQATKISYKACLYKNRDLIMVAQVSSTGVLDLLEKYTERGSSAKTIADYLPMLRTKGHSETIGHMVNGHVYSMRFTKNEA